ncbi:MAG TPA: PIN domain-containing protein [Candidatus Nanoarchaeia archaeon]|nr:PIN domain-containing protein [Candidatus Nanoarchaeia archaeon]
MILLDASAWIEFFLESEKFSKTEQIIESEQACTSMITFAEIANWCNKNNKDVSECIKFIKNGSEIINLNEGIIVAAGRLNYERKKKIPKWGMIDSLILATAQMYDLTILTKDRDFRDLPNVELL